MRSGLSNQPKFAFSSRRLPSMLFRSFSTHVRWLCARVGPQVAHYPRYESIIYLIASLLNARNLA